MKKNILISCVSMKLNHTSKAKDLYISTLFKKNLAYAKQLNPDNIFILSAKYGLVSLNEEIEPYDKTLNKMKVKEIKEWSENVLLDLKEITDLKKDKFIFLAGKNYRKFLISEMNNIEIPMEGLGIGKQLQWLTKKVTYGSNL